MSQLRVNEFVNSDDTGAPSFPNSATTIQPTESDQFATKLYVDQNSAIVTPITNNISPTEPSNPSVGDFWTDISDLTLITLSVWNGSEWITVKATQDNPTTEAPGPVAGSIISPPSILDDNSGYIPAMLTAVSANVSDATLASSKWYKDDVEIPGATGLQFYATEIGTYKYEEVWEDAFGNQLFPSLAAVIDARAGVILSQPTVSSSNGDYIPTVLTVTPGVVADAEFAGSKWYKDGVEIPGETGTTLSVSDIGIYMYRESWTDFFTTELLPVIAVTIDARTGIIATQPTITSSNGDYIPTVLTATRADVDHATFVGSKWYKDDVEIPGETGTTLSVSDIGVYKYEEVWTDYFSTEFLPALSATIDARRGIIATQPTITSSNGNYSPATLVATRAHVDNATFVESKWYKDGVEIPGETGLSITISATESGTYTYQEVWTDYFSTEFLPALGASLQVFGEIATPSVLSPADDTGVPDFDYTAKSSAITNASVVPATNYTGNLSGTTLSASDLNNMFKSTLEYVDLNLNETLTFTNDTGRTVYVAFRHLHNSPHDPNTRVETYRYSNGSRTGSTYTTHSSVWPNHPDGWNTSTFSCPAGSTIGLEPISLPTNGRVSIDGFYFEDTDEKLVNASASATLTLTDTTVSKVSDGSLVEGVSIDQALTVGESVKAAGIESYWLTMLSHSSTDARAEPRGLAVDNAGNIYIAGEESSTDNAAYVAKFNAGGNITWQKSLNYYGANEAANDIAIDSLNNLYYCGYSQMAGNNGVVIAKYNSTGTLQWQRLLNNLDHYIGAYAITTDSSDNLIIVGWAKVGSSSPYGALIVKYNSSGQIQWKRGLNTNRQYYNDYAYGVAVDSSDNIYMCGSCANYSSTDCLIAKYDASGNLQWQKALGDRYTSKGERFRDITVDSSDNIYVVGHSEKPTDNDDTLIAKYDTSGNLVWQKYIQNDASGKAIDTDSSGNVYILSENIREAGGAGGADLYFAKLDSSGNFEWQRTLGGASNEITFNLCVDSSDNLYISGATRSPSANTTTEGLLLKIPNDGSLVGTYGGLTYQSVSLNTGSSTLDQRDISLEDLSLPRIDDSASALPDQFDPGYTANVTAITGASGTVSAYSGNTITLSDVSGTWSTGMKIEGVTIDNKDNPDAVNPYTVSLTSSEPTASAGVIVSWANAEWEVAEDSGFTSNVQSAVSSLTSSGTQVGPTGFAFDGSKNYYVRTKYNSSNPPSVQSEWSPTNMFITGVKATVSLPSIFSPVDGEGVGLPRTYTPKTSAITSIDFDSNWTPSAFESLTGISDKSYHYYTFSNTNAYDGNTQLSQSLTEAFPVGTQVDVPGGGYVSGYTSNSENSVIMQIRKDEKEINSSTYIDNPSVRDTFPQYFDNLYHMPGYNGPHGRYIMTHSNFDTFYSDDGGATIRPLGEIPNEAGAMSADCFAYNPLTQVLIVTKAATYTGGRLIWYSNNGGASWTKATNTSVGGQSWRHPYFVAFSYDSNGNPTSGELRVNTSSDNYITSNHARSTDGVNWYPLQGISTGWPGVGHYYHVAADKCVVLEQKRNGMHIKYGPGTGVNITSGEQYSNMSSFPRESIDGDLEQIDKVVYDPYLGKMFMFGGWEPRVWYSDNATHWTRKEMSPAGGSPNVINTGSSYLYVFQKYRDFYYTTDPSQNSSTWTHVQNALPYMSNPKDMVNKMIVGGHNNAGVGYYSELGIAGYNAGYSMGDTISALTSTTIPGLPANAVSPTSSAPTSSAGTISSWDYAEWQLATDAAFTQNVQTSTASLSSSGTQSGPSFSYNNGTVYYIRTRYVAADPVGPVSDWSSPIHFQTAP